MTIAIQLRKPIRVLDQVITSVQFREPTGEDLIGLPSLEADKMGFAIALADRTALNLPPGTVKALPALDAMAAGAAVTAALNPTEAPPDSSNSISSAADGGAISAASSG